MRILRLLAASLLVLPLLGASLASAQDSARSPEIRTIPYEDGLISREEWAKRCEDWDDWDKPVNPFSVTAQVWYVGTCGITVLLVTTPEGHVLFDSGTERGARVVNANLFKIPARHSEIRLILVSHEHFDHVGGLSFIQSITYAPVVANSVAAEVLRSGESDPSDPQAGMHEPMAPAPNVITYAPGSPVSFAGITFTPIATPGHTPGATSWQWETCDVNERCKTIVYADSLSPVSNDTYRFSDHPEYLAQYRAGIERLRGLKCDILLTPHPSHSRMIERAATGTFEGGMSCAEYADAKTAALDERLAKEAAQ